MNQRDEESQAATDYADEIAKGLGSAVVLLTYIGKNGLTIGFAAYAPPRDLARMIVALRAALDAAEKSLRASIVIAGLSHTEFDAGLREGPNVEVRKSVIEE